MIKFYFLIGAVFLFASNAQPSGNTSEIKKSTEIDKKLIAEVAAVSAKLEWCGFQYKYFYLTFMQYQRVPETLSQPQLIAVGAEHGYRMQIKVNELNKNQCSDADKKLLSTEYKNKLADWCRFADRREQLKINCKKANEVIQ